MPEEEGARKMEKLKVFFDKTFDATVQTEPYQAFVNDNPWLTAYAQFKALKEQFGGKHWQEWPLKARADKKAADFYVFLQFHAFRQMEQVKSHANAKQVFLKGDIPILISPDSADVWSESGLFNLNMGAGAPPDAYNPLGQSWGFPLFNWDAMKKEDNRWWKQRLSVAGKFYHIYRIDHVVGFFRIWGIERGKKAVEGSFFPPDPAVWMRHGKEILEMMIDASSLLPMAEDLGTIPEGVYPILKELGICGTKVIRWQRKEGRYIPFNEYEPLSLTTLSTSDMEPLGLWWKKYPAESVPFAEYMRFAYHPILSRAQRFKILQAAHHTASFFHINLLQEYLALFPELVSPRPEDERINIPGTILPTNWTYRFRPSLEEIISHEGLKEALRSIPLHKEPEESVPFGA